MTNEIALDIRSLSQSTTDGRCLEVWFVKNVTDEDRGNLLKAVNLLRAFPAQGEPVAWRTNTGAATTEKRMADIWRDTYGFAIEPLYAAIQSSPAPHLAVSPADIRGANAHRAASSSERNGAGDPSDAWCEAFLKASGDWVEPYEAATECGVQVECEITPEWAAELNAKSIAHVRKAYLAAAAALLKP